MAREAAVLSPRARASRGLLTCYGLSIYLFLFAPIVLLVLFSFNANTYGSFPITGWTTKWYAQVFGDYQIQDALRTTLKVGLEVTLVSVLLGTAAAFPLVRAGLPFPAGFRVAMTLPIMIPGILIGISLLVLFTQVVKVPLSPSTAVIGQSLYTTPFVLLLVAARLQGFDRNLERAAGDLGANTFNRLRLIVLPLIFPAILAGALFAFTLSFDEFVITYFIIGGYNTLPIYIYTQIRYGITPEVNALAALVLITSIALISLVFILPAGLRLARRLAGSRARRTPEALPETFAAPKG
ncbi:MAG: ABC transporter permease [Deltaproteobacteria bacterium]|nr:MAG: ABC transporter permease [Deltaproteobacteria bacterium]